MRVRARVEYIVGFTLIILCVCIYSYIFPSYFRVRASQHAMMTRSNVFYSFACTYYSFNYFVANVMLAMWIGYVLFLNFRHPIATVALFVVLLLYIKWLMSFNLVVKSKLHSFRTLVQDARCQFASHLDFWMAAYHILINYNGGKISFVKGLCVNTFARL